MNHLGKEIHRFRKERGYTQLALAEMSGTTQPQIANIEKGKISPRLDTLTSIANALNLEISLCDKEVV